MLDFLLGYAGPRARQTSLDRSDLFSKDQQLEARLNALELACAGMWQLMKAQGMSDGQLEEAIAKADAADGERDHRIRPGPQKCPKCGRVTLSRSVAMCLWCGAPMEVKAFG